MGNRQTVEKINESFAKGSTEGFLSFCTDDVEWTMIGEKSVKGKERIRDWMASMDMEPPKFTVTALIEDGDLVAAYGEMTMREKSGETVPYEYCDIYRFRDGNVAELRSFVVKTGKKEASGSSESG